MKPVEKVINVTSDNLLNYSTFLHIVVMSVYCTIDIVQLLCFTHTSEARLCCAGQMFMLLPAYHSATIFLICL